MSEGLRARVLARRGLRRGCRSRLFSLSELVDVEFRDHDENVYVEVDACGQLTARGGLAHAARTARLAPAPPAASALLCVESPATADGALRLRLAADVAPLQELLLWFDEHTLALLDMPFLTLRNITGKKYYSCHECGAEFEHPNPLKIHMFLSCRPYNHSTFWSRCVDRLRAATVAPLVPTFVSSLSLPTVSVIAPPAMVADPARIEALAAAWGRSRDGHVCVYCGKLYSRKYGLKIHIRTHTGYKPLRCRHCLRAFGDPSNLNKHVRLHATDAAGSGAAHACSLCRKPLARRRDLLRHLRAHHPHALSTSSHS